MHPARDGARLLLSGVECCQYAPSSRVAGARRCVDLDTTLGATHNGHHPLLASGQRLLEVRHEILDRLDPNREPQQVVGHA